MFSEQEARVIQELESLVQSNTATPDQRLAAHRSICQIIFEKHEQVLARDTVQLVTTLNMN